MNILSNSTIAIIGAGMAGIACAQRLQRAGYRPTVFDKGRGIGGRMASRRAGEAGAFDHGAQFLTARTLGFQSCMDRMLAGGAVAEWHPVSAPVRTPKDGPWYVGNPAMNSPVKHLASGIDIQLSDRVTGLAKERNGWRLKTEKDPVGKFFDLVICTTPAPQARDLVAEEPDLIAALSDVTMAPCWALMLAFKSKPDFEFEVWRSDTEDISWISCQSSKPGRTSDGLCWTVHASPQWSQQNLELEAGEVAQLMLDNLRQKVAFEPSSVVYSATHRWRYARTLVPLGRPFLLSEDRSLYVGGDWCLGPRVECAFESGIAISNAILGSAA